MESGCDKLDSGCNKLYLSTSVVPLSIDNGEGCNIFFDIVGDLTYNGTILHLCWVDEEGSLEVYKQLQPPTNCFCQDTFAGHGWVLYRLPRSSKSQPSKTSDIKENNLICGFRPIVKGEFTVVVQLGSNGSVDVRAHSESCSTRATKGMRPVDLTLFPVDITSDVHDVSLNKSFATLRWRECRTKVKSKARPSCDIVFHIVGALAHKNSGLHLCWVHKNGSLEIYQRPSPPSDFVEIESFVGHAWVLYRLPNSCKSEPAKTSDIKPQYLVCAFLPWAAGEHTVVVRLGSNGSVHVQTWNSSDTRTTDFKGRPMAKNERLRKCRRAFARALHRPFASPDAALPASPDAALPTDTGRLHSWFQVYPGLLRLVGGMMLRYYDPQSLT